MKKNYMLCVAALTALLISGCGNSKSRIEYIGAEQAKQLAINAAGLTTDTVSSLTADLDSHNGTDYYQVEFASEEGNYQYDIDALTGIIIDSRTPEPAKAPEPDSALSDSGSAPTDSGSSPPDSAGTSQSEKISDEQAKSIALAHAGLTADQVTFAKSRLEIEDGLEVYDIEFYTADHTEYDYDIDAYSGEVLKYDYDAEDVSPPAAADNSSIITEEKAKELALAQVPGASIEHIREFKTDYEDGHTEYEGTIVYNGMEYEFEIDAYSGAFRSWETEPID